MTSQVLTMGLGTRVAVPPLAPDESPSEHGWIFVLRFRLVESAAAASDGILIARAGLLIGTSRLRPAISSSQR
jgi:hypothetical protein